MRYTSASLDAHTPAKVLKAARAARSSPTPAAMAQCCPQANQRETAQERNQQADTVGQLGEVGEREEQKGNDQQTIEQPMPRRPACHSLPRQQVQPGQAVDDSSHGADDRASLIRQTDGNRDAE